MLPEPAPSRHRFDLGSLLAAVLFAGVAMVGLLGRTVSLGREVRWIWPILFLGTGIALLISAASRAKAPAAVDFWDMEQALDRTLDRTYVPGMVWSGGQTGSAGEQGTSDEVGAERGQDGEVEQAGGGHDG